MERSSCRRGGGADWRWGGGGWCARARAGFRQRVVPGGGTGAGTHLNVRGRLGGVTLVEARLETGLKNQIRVQFQAAGHPLMGDRHYAPAEKDERFLNRQALHAWRLSFLHPRTGRMVGYESPLTAELQLLVERLRLTTDGEPELSRHRRLVSFCKAVP